MLKQIISVILFSCGVFTSCQKSNDAILNRSISKLYSFNTIEFIETIDWSNKEQGLDFHDSAFCFFDFTSADSLLGAKYQFVFNQGEQVFNGKGLFHSDKTEEQIVFYNEPSTRVIYGSMVMYNSIFIIKKVLPEFLKNTSIVINRQNDTLINGEKNYSFNINIKDNYLDYDATLTYDKGISENYNLIISKQSYLPKQFTSFFSRNKGYRTATFSNIKSNILRPDSIWEYDRFPHRYLRVSNQDLIKRVKAKADVNIGKKAPNWSLPSIGGDSIQLSRLKGSLVLLEFWFPYCGGCILAIPEINTLQDVYLDKGLKIYGIEFAKSNGNGLDDYIKKQNILYPTLHTGKYVADNYGVTAAPTFFLIDKKGIILYSSVGFNKNELIKAINESIK
jgi:peroxiredoxin